MDQPRGLRDRKKCRTRDALSTAAIALFLERGFDRVSVAEIAAAADVSKPTLFSYFATKEDLALHRVLDHRGEAARVVRDRPAGQPPLAALEEHFIAGLRREEPTTGLCSDREVLAYHRMLFSTPSLLARLAQYTAADEDDLAQALTAAAGSAPRPEGSRSGSRSDQRAPAGEHRASAVEDSVLVGEGRAPVGEGRAPTAAAGLDARVAAAAVVAVQRVLARENWRRLDDGATVAELLPAAEAAARRAFAALRGLADLPEPSLPADLSARSDGSDGSGPAC